MECARLIKQKDKNDKKYISKAQEKRFELLILKEALKMKNEQLMVSKIGKEMKMKEEKIDNENKIILKKDKEAKKLEQLEVEVLKRLRDTHIKQQQAIEEIQTIFENRKKSLPLNKREDFYSPNKISQQQFSTEFQALSDLAEQEDGFGAENHSSMQDQDQNQFKNE